MTGPFTLTKWYYWYYYLDENDQNAYFKIIFDDQKDDDNLIKSIISKIVLFEKNHLIFKKRYLLVIIFSILKNLFNLIAVTVAIVAYCYHCFDFLFVFSLSFDVVCIFNFFIFCIRISDMIFSRFFDTSWYPIILPVYLSRITAACNPSFVNRFGWYYIFIIAKNIHINIDEFNEVLKKIFRIKRIIKHNVSKKKKSLVINDQNLLLNILSWLHLQFDSRYPSAINTENSVQLIKNCNKKTFYKEMKLPARLFIIYLINLLICFAISLTLSILII